jgi:hypothetical protein
MMAFHDVFANEVSKFKYHQEIQAKYQEEIQVWQKKLKWYRQQALEITYLVEMHIFTLDVGKESIFFQSAMKPIKS